MTAFLSSPHAHHMPFFVSSMCPWSRGLRRHDSNKTNGRPTIRLIFPRGPFHVNRNTTRPAGGTTIGMSFSGHKNLDTPAVQLKGPFLQDRLIPPPAHRNVVMIAAGTGVNPSERSTCVLSMWVFSLLVLGDREVSCENFRAGTRQKDIFALSLIHI